MNRHKNNLHNEVIYFQGQRGDSQVEISRQYTDGYSENVLTFAQSYGVLVLIIVLSVVFASGLILVKKPKEILSQIS